MVKVFKKYLQKKYNWKCIICNDTTLYPTQPFCKSCCHIEKKNIDMVIVND